MKELDCHIWVTSPAVGATLGEMKDKINEMVTEINELKIQLSRVKKDRKDPRSKSPYDLNNARR